MWTDLSAPHLSAFIPRPEPRFTRFMVRPPFPFTAYPVITRNNSFSPPRLPISHTCRPPGRPRLSCQGALPSPTCLACTTAPTSPPLLKHVPACQLFPRLCILHVRTRGITVSRPPECAKIFDRLNSGLGQGHRVIEFPASFLIQYVH